MTKDELEVAIKSANLWSGRSTLVLAIGILGEYVLLPFLEKKRWQRTAKILFAVLVVAGIVGEYEFSSQIAKDADELQRRSDAELSDAKAKAGAAIERAEQIRKDNLLLEDDVLRLRVSLANRTLTKEQQRNIGNACSLLAGKKVFLQSYKNDLEADALIRQLIEALRLAHIEAVDEHGKLEATWSSVTNILGIQIIPVNLERPLAQALRKSLHDDGGLVVDEITDLGTDVTDIQILVGTNPHKLLK